MPYVTIEVDAKEKREKLLKLYHEFTLKNEPKPQSFNSLEEFKKSQSYKSMSGDEQNALEEECQGKNVIILVFKTEQEAKDFINMIKDQGLISKIQAESVIEKIGSPVPSSSHRLGM